MYNMSITLQYIFLRFIYKRKVLRLFTNIHSILLTFKGNVPTLLLTGMNFFGTKENHHNKSKYIIKPTKQ